jgi:hypothetical protein
MKNNRYFTELTVIETSEINGGSLLSWVRGFIEGTIDYLVEQESQRITDAATNGGNVAVVVAFK